MREISNWGNYPKAQARFVEPEDECDVLHCQTEFASSIARGNGRCYGDSALGDAIISTLKLNKFIHFDRVRGYLTCESGVLLSDILDVIIRQGFFLSVTPGTKLVTLGGAIASDVHGKNHHVDGCFSQFVRSIRILVGERQIVRCSRTEKSDLFWATCGGMGLTGIILSATIELKKIETRLIRKRTIACKNLEDVIDKFEYYDNWRYSVAWVDGSAKNSCLGRSILFLGEHATGAQLQHHGIENSLKTQTNNGQSVAIPIFMPSFLLNRFAISAFNAAYFYRNKLRHEKEEYVDLTSFFYPLDSIVHWNRVYGRKGFLQYQFVLPTSSSRIGLEKILSKISSSGLASFLSVLKLFGDRNPNQIMSFPEKGFTLAMDFKNNQNTRCLLRELDQILKDFGGKIYLAKDARMSRELFEQTYRKRIKSSIGFDSLQSKRLGI